MRNEKSLSELAKRLAVRETISGTEGALGESLGERGEFTATVLNIST